MPLIKTEPVVSNGRTVEECEFEVVVAERRLQDYENLVKSAKKRLSEAKVQLAIAEELRRRSKK